MAKPKSPLLSLGARGTIADTLTYQKRGRDTIVREKPIPKDPKSESQLAQRQKYKDAIAIWNALTAEEKDAWRGVCPDLTAYQCFMSSELKYVPPPPPPEEYTEEQTQHSYSLTLEDDKRHRVGQRLTISNRKVTKLGFWLLRIGTPTGDVTFEIRRVSDDSLISSQVWGDAGDIPLVITYEEVEFPDPQTINEEVRIYVHNPDGFSYNAAVVRYAPSDVKAGEYLTTWLDPTWTNFMVDDCAYRYKYYLV